MRGRRWVTPLGVVDFFVVLAVIYVTVSSLHPSLLVSGTTLTGGDTGSHLALPAYLRTTGNLLNLTPWYPGWLAGIPAYTYYFVLPDFLATLASYVVSFAVAFKLATILGSVLMPVCAYAMGRLFRAPRPIPAALALATLPFLFDASFTIVGGNLFSSMAGEYSFALSLALAMVTLGLFDRGLRSGRGYWLAALALSATLAAHVLPWLFTLGAVAILVVFELLRRRGHGDPRDRVSVRGDYARPVRFAVGAGLISFGLSAWWLLPFVTTQSLTDSLGYTNDNVSSPHVVLTTLGWFNATGGAGGDRWVMVLAAWAVVVALVVRDRLGMILSALVGASLLAYLLDPQSVIWNERLVPFWFLTSHLLAGWLVGYGAWRWVGRRARRGRDDDLAWEDGSDDGDDAALSRGDASRARASVGGAPALSSSGLVTGAAQSRDGHLESRSDDHAATERDHGDVDGAAGQRREGRTLRATLVVALLGFASTVPGLITPWANALHLSTTGNQVTSWAQWNYSGYQAKAAWPEYHGLMETMSRLGRRYGCGRAMWEYSATENRFGTPEALMLLPYWTNNCIDSMEGLLMESSPTTPYHYLDQSELSVAPSNPQVGLRYGPLDVALGVRHLQMLGVKYFMAFSPAVVTQANADPELQLVASTRAWPSPGVRWRIYLIHHSPMVQALAHEPNVVANVSSGSTWLAANQTWWLDPALQRVYVAETGPPSWPRATSVSAMHAGVKLPPVKVTAVSIGLQSLSFHVSRLAVPMLVKISYYPRWRVSGAAGPYRVSPNLMVVVPTSHEVSLTYATTRATSLGSATTDVTVLMGFAVLYVLLRRRRNRPR